MNVYLETSAVLSWMLEEPDCLRIENLLRVANLMLTSALTDAEIQRSMTRLGAGPEPRGRWSVLQQSISRIPLSQDLLDKVGQEFPIEPVRTVDAIHLVCATEMRGRLPDLRILSLDRRVRDNAAALAFSVLPV